MPLAAVVAVAPPVPAGNYFDDVRDVSENFFKQECDARAGTSQQVDEDLHAVGHDDGFDPTGDGVSRTDGADEDDGGDKLPGGRLEAAVHEQADGNRRDKQAYAGREQSAKKHAARRDAHGFAETLVDVA